MTNEERINLRERALRLSIEIRNPYSGQTAMYMWAEHIYKFLSSDGLSLHEAEHMAKIVSLMDSEISEPEKSRNEPKEIDWSRLQLVDNGLGLIVKTDGAHTEHNFEGSVMSVGTSNYEIGHIRNSWVKGVFKYHGEIPQEQKTEGLNFLDAMRATLGGFTAHRPNNADYIFDTEQLCIKMVTPIGSRAFPVIYQDDILATDWQITK